MWEGPAFGIRDSAFGKRWRRPCVPLSVTRIPYPESRLVSALIGKDTGKSTRIGRAAAARGSIVIAQNIGEEADSA